MKPFLRGLLQAGVIASAGFARVWRTFERLLYSKEEAARRASGRFETLKRKVLEAERLDRLRNPDDYRGR